MEMTARLNLPLLAVAQAAKEMTVNEALIALDAAVQPVVEGEVSDPPMSPDPRQSWLVGVGATGAFAGKDGAIATWTAGGWRFAAPFDGMALWRLDKGAVVRRIGGAWQSGNAVNVPTGGTVIDVEARAAIEMIVARLREAGMTAA
jgi:hypothetical protein